MDFIPASNPTSSTGSSSKANNTDEKKGVKKRKGVKLSTEPQSVAARERRHRISDRFKILQSMVPGGSKMDTVSMLEEAIHYVKFLKSQILLHQTMMNFVNNDESHMLLPEHIIFFQQNTSSGDFVQTLTQQPLAQCFFQEEDAKFVATSQYWPA